MTEWRVWLKGLMAAMVGGAANSVTAMVMDPQQFNLTEGLPKLGTFAAVGAILAGALYLKESPLPGCAKGQGHV